MMIVFAPTVDCTQPFQVDVFTNGISDTDAGSPNTVAVSHGKLTTINFLNKATIG